MAAEDMAPTILGVIISVLALGGLFIALRVYTRTVLKRGAFGWDDTLIIITWVSITSLCPLPLIDSLENKTPY